MNLNSDIWEEDVEEDDEEEEEKEEREAMEKEEEYNRIAVTYQWMHCLTSVPEASVAATVYSALETKDPFPNIVR